MTLSRITCIDDNTTNLRLLEKSLADDYEIQLIASSHDAVSAIRTFQPAAILLDVNMPEINGYALCRQIRNEPDIAEIPVIFLSCLKELDDRLSGYNAGGDAYVTKPFELRELKSILHSQILRKQQMDANKRNIEELRAVSWSMLRNNSEMGELLRFSQGIAGVKDEAAFVDHIFTTLTNLGLNATMQVKLVSGEIIARSDQKPFTLIEKELLELAQNGQRISAKGNKYIFCGTSIILLIRNMPIEDEALLGRLKDHLCILLDSAEASIEIINGEKERTRLHGLKTLETIETINAEFSAIIENAEKLYQQSSLSMERLADALEQAFMVMDLTDEQEKQLQRFIESARSEIEKQHELKLLFQSSMIHILEMVADLKGEAE